MKRKVEAIKNAPRNFRKAQQHAATRTTLLCVKWSKLYRAEEVLLATLFRRRKRCWTKKNLINANEEREIAEPNNTQQTHQHTSFFIDCLMTFDRAAQCSCEFLCVIIQDTNTQTHTGTDILIELKTHRKHAARRRATTTTTTTWRQKQ